MTASENDPFSSAKSRIARSNEHMTELEGLLNSFVLEKPYELMSDIDPSDSTQELFKLKFKNRLPDRSTQLAQEALEALRSALDQTSYAAAVASGKVAPKKTQFPISDSVAELENLIVGRKVCKDVPEEIVSLFRSFKPYKGGNHYLWALNQLRNSAHTVLVPVMVSGANIHIHHRTGSAEINAVNPIYDSEKNEIIFGRGPIGENWDCDIHSSISISFNNAQVSRREYAIAFLHRTRREVDSILSATEKKCRSLGFIS
jgi:hypothetical protein